MYVSHSPELFSLNQIQNMQSSNARLGSNVILIMSVTLEPLLGVTSMDSKILELGIKIFIIKLVDREISLYITGHIISKPLLGKQNSENQD